MVLTCRSLQPATADCPQEPVREDAMAREAGDGTRSRPADKGPDAGPCKRPDGWVERSGQKGTAGHRQCNRHCAGDGKKSNRQQQTSQRGAGHPLILARLSRNRCHRCWHANLAKFAEQRVIRQIQMFLHVAPRLLDVAVHQHFENRGVRAVGRAPPLQRRGDFVTVKQMNITALNGFRRGLAAHRPAIGLWVTLDSPSITEIAVALGLDWVVVDAEHGHLDWQEIVAHLRAAVRSSTVVLVRIAELNGGLIKRALDLGADGIVIPWIESAEQLRQAVRFCRYPPEGMRGIGAERATVWGQAFLEHAAEANDHVLVVPIIETVRAASQVPAMLAVEGVEVFFFGPADFSASAGYRGQWEGPGIADEILKLKNSIQAAGKSCGVMATSQENLQQRVAQGFQVVGLGTDAGLLIRGMRENLSMLGRDGTPRANMEAGVPTVATQEGNP